MRDVAYNAYFSYYWKTGHMRDPTQNTFYPGYNMKYTYEEWIKMYPKSYQSAQKNYAIGLQYKKVVDICDMITDFEKINLSF